MRKILHKQNGRTVTEFVGDSTFFCDKTALQIMMDAAYDGSQKLIFHQTNIDPQFFDLKSGVAGEILQKAANYKIQLAIVGDFSNVSSQSLKAFISECNQGRQIFFVKDVLGAITRLGKVNL